MTETVAPYFRLTKGECLLIQGLPWAGCDYLLCRPRVDARGWWPASVTTLLLPPFNGFRFEMPE